jgi:hypothetical protein
LGECDDKKPLQGYQTKLHEKRSHGCRRGAGQLLSVLSVPTKGRGKADGPGVMKSFQENLAKVKKKKNERQYRPLA